MFGAFENSFFMMFNVDAKFSAAYKLQIAFDPFFCGLSTGFMTLYRLENRRFLIFTKTSLQNVLQITVFAVFSFFMEDPIALSWGIFASGLLGVVWSSFLIMGKSLWHIQLYNLVELPFS